MLHYWMLGNFFKIKFQSAADDSEAKSNELTRAVDELHKLLKEAGEGKTFQLWEDYFVFREKVLFSLPFCRFLDLEVRYLIRDKIGCRRKILRSRNFKFYFQQIFENISS